MNRILGAFILSSLLGSTASADIRIHELLYNPTGDDAGNEIIELYNDGNQTVDLSWWAVFVDSRTTFRNDIYLFEDGRTIPPGGYLTIHWQASGTGDADDLYTESEGSWYTGGSQPMENDWLGVSLFEDDNDRFVGPDFSDHLKIRDFVQIGDDATSRESIATEAGIWLDNDVVVPRAEGISFVHDGTGRVSGDWFGDVRGFQQGDNAIPTRPAYTYGSSCSGSGGFSPIIPDVDSLPGDDTTMFQVTLINGLGPLAFLVVGYEMDQVSFGPSCTLWTSFDFLIGPFPMEGGPGQGEGRLTLDAYNPLPGSDLEIFLTFFCQDDSESKGFTLSNALALKL